MNINSDDFYNFDVKKEFLDYLRKEGNREYRNAESALKKFNQLERAKKLDLYAFPNELILNKFAKMQEQSAYSYAKIYNMYKEWAALRFIDVNETMITREMIKEYITESVKNKFLKGIFSYNTLLELQEKCICKQNIVHITLAFEGVLGKRDNEEIINLKLNDINYENCTINLKNDRVIKVNRKALYFLKQACNEKVGERYDYIKNQYTEVEFVNTEYVCKCTTKASNQNSKVSVSVLRERNDYVRRKIGNNLLSRNISAKTAKNSGMLFYISMIEKKLGKQINNELVFKVIKKYGGTYSLVSSLKSAHDIYRVEFKEDIDNTELSTEIIEIIDSILNIKLSEQDYIYLKGLNLSHKKNISSANESQEDSSNKRHERFEYTDNFDSDWATELKLYGTKGEKYVLEYIRNSVNNIIVNKVLDKYGFDLFIEEHEYMLEIKTTSLLSMTIHLSKTEIERGINNPAYKIIVLVSKDSNEYADKVVINNSSEILSEAQKLILNKTYYENAEFTIDSVSINLTNDYIKKQQSLSEFVNTLNMSNK